MRFAESSPKERVKWFRANGRMPRTAFTDAVLASDMSSTEKAEVITFRRVITAVVVVLCVFIATFPTYYGVKRVSDNSVQRTCIQSGKNWAMVPNTSRYECR